MNRASYPGSQDCFPDLRYSLLTHPKPGGIGPVLENDSRSSGSSRRTITIRRFGVGKGIDADTDKMVINSATKYV